LIGSIKLGKNAITVFFERFLLLVDLVNERFQNCFRVQFLEEEEVLSKYAYWLSEALNSRLVFVAENDEFSGLLGKRKGEELLRLVVAFSASFVMCRSLGKAAAEVTFQPALLNKLVANKEK
jgi:hypothetical protein